MNAPQPIAAPVTLAEQLHAVELLERGVTRVRVGPFTTIRIVAALYSIEETELLSPRRAPILVEARALVTWVLRSVPSEPVSYPKIGRALGDRHHTTIMHLHLMAIRLRLEDKVFARRCDAIDQYFKLTEDNHDRFPAFG